MNRPTANKHNVLLRVKSCGKSSLNSHKIIVHEVLLESMQAQGNYIVVNCSRFAQSNYLYNKRWVAFLGMAGSDPWKWQLQDLSFDSFITVVMPRTRNNCNYTLF